MVIRRAGALSHASSIGSRRIVASNTGSLHAAMVHFLYTK